MRTSSPAGRQRRPIQHNPHMEPATLTQLNALVTHIGADLQRLEDRLKQNGDQRCKVRFPRGFPRKTQNFRSRYSFIRDSHLKRNVAYSLILSDFYRWVLNRTDVWGTPREMIIKEAICLIGAVAESVTKDAMQDHCGKHTGYKKRTAKMVEHDRASGPARCPLGLAQRRAPLHAGRVGIRQVRAAALQRRHSHPPPPPRFTRKMGHHPERNLTHTICQYRAPS